MWELNRKPDNRSIVAVRRRLRYRKRYGIQALGCVSMQVHLYQDWVISIANSSNQRWMFYVCRGDDDPLTNHSLHDSPDNALVEAQRFIDRQIAQQEILETLDSLLESKAISADVFARLIQLLQQL